MDPYKNEWGCFRILYVYLIYSLTDLAAIRRRQLIFFVFLAPSGPFAGILSHLCDAPRRLGRCWLIAESHLQNAHIYIVIGGVSLARHQFSCGATLEWEVGRVAFWVLAAVLQEGRRELSSHTSAKQSRAQLAVASNASQSEEYNKWLHGRAVRERGNASAHGRAREELYLQAKQRAAWALLICLPSVLVHILTPDVP